MHLTAELWTAQAADCSQHGLPHPKCDQAMGLMFQPLRCRSQLTDYTSRTTTWQGICFTVQHQRSQESSSLILLASYGHKTWWHNMMKKKKKKKKVCDEEDVLTYKHVGCLWFYIIRNYIIKPPGTWTIVQCIGYDSRITNQLPNWLTTSVHAAESFLRIQQHDS